MERLLNSMLDPMTVLVVLNVALVVFVLFLYVYLRKRLKKDRTTELLSIKAEVRELAQTIEASAKSAGVAAAIEEKKNKFLNLPNISFHYADKERIKNFYNDYFREPTIDNIVRELASEVNGDIQAGLPKVLETRAGGKDLSKWISTLKLPDTSVNGMFHRYQRETIKRNQVNIGLEIVDVELSELDSFEKLIGEFNLRFGFKINEESLEEQKAIIKEKAAGRTLSKLEQATGWILMEGSFNIEDSGDGFYRCTYKHPVSDYMLTINKLVTISMIIPKNLVEAHVAGNYAQSIGKIIPLRVYGEVWQPLIRNADIWDLQLTPLAVY